MKKQNGCKCQGCGQYYKIDINIPDELWEKIKPAGKPPGAGLLCGVCIMKKLIKLDFYGSFELTRFSNIRKINGKKQVHQNVSD